MGTGRDIPNGQRTMNEIGRIRRVPLREVWPHEAHDFTRWLEGNLDIVNEVLGTQLISAAREQAAGSFSVDLLAEDAQGNATVIENQLGRSDHDHLGKLITYLTAFEAKAAIWIVGDPRPEHVAAITWLNESGLASFYLLKVEAVRIGDSLPAPVLTLIVGPSAEALEVGAQKKERAERHILRNRFWTGLLERAKERTRLHAGTNPNDSPYLETRAGKAGLSYGYVLSKNETRVELYISRPTAEESRVIFDMLASDKSAIEADFGDSLSWEPMEGKRACRIARRMQMGGYRDPESEWGRIQDSMIDAMIQLDRALGPRVAKLAV